MLYFLYFFFSRWSDGFKEMFAILLLICDRLLQTVLRNVKLLIFVIRCRCL